MLILVVVMIFSPLVSPARADGSGTSGDPYTELKDAYRVTSAGRYYFDTGSGLFQADVDPTEGGGWVLVLQYVHEGGTTPDKVALGAGDDFPVLSTAPLGTDESEVASQWGHAGNAALNQFSEDLEVRFYGETSNHARILHVSTTLGSAYLKSGSGSFSGGRKVFKALTGHTTNIPATATSSGSNNGDSALTNHTFFHSGVGHWNIDEGSKNRWEVDDFPDSAANDTIHRVWVRSTESGTIVTNTNDSGGGSLRSAIDYANANADEDAITFNISGAGPHIITLTSGLLTISDDGVSIDGTTQSGASCGDLWAGTPHTLLIQLDKAGNSGDTIRVNGDNVSLRGLSMVDAGSSSILFDDPADSGSISCSYLGLQTDGTAESNNYGIATEGSNITIGGASVGDGNVISGNRLDGILNHIAGSGLTIQGNFIGTDPTGASAVQNGRHGIGNHQSTSSGVTWNAVRENLISGNNNSGVFLTNRNPVTGSSGDVIFAGNYIGVDRTGLVAIANGEDALHFETGSITGATIGGETADDRNILSGNAQEGVHFDAVTGITLIGNYIGLGADASTALENGYNGVLITNSSEVAVVSNLISANGGLGLDLGDEEATANDSGDGDSGPNDLLNFPVLNEIAADGTTTINYDFNLDVPANANGYRIEFFKNSTGDASGHGEAEIYLGSIDVAHSGGDTNFTGSFTAGSAASAGDSITATTTRKTGAISYDITSEFAANLTAVSAVDPLVVTSTADTDTLGTLRYAINHANANTDADAITFNIDGAGPHVIALASSLPSITDADVSIDGSSQAGASCGQLTTGTQHVLQVQLDGAALTSGSALTIEAGSVQVSGLSVINAFQSGIVIKSAGNNSVIECSYIGVETDGETSGSNNRTGGSYLAGIDVNFADNVTIRNTLISGNDASSGVDGIRLDDGATGTVITGNIIGLNAAGTSALGNANNGIVVDSQSYATIGGTTAILRNVISGNNDGIIFRVDSGGGTVLGNYIGLGADGTSPLGNTVIGVQIANSASNIVLGDGTTDGGNKISDNGTSGIHLTDSVQAAFLGNSIYANDQLGINLVASGESANTVTLNDAGDSDTGPNDLLNVPVLNILEADGTTNVAYDLDLDTAANADGYRIEFFKNSSADSSSHGEGEIYLGYIDTGAHSAGNQNYSGSFTANETVSAGDIISATTTRKTGVSSYDVTSEFSLNLIAGEAELTAERKIAIYDPSAEGLYMLPGNDVVVSLTVTNIGTLAADTDSLKLIDNIPDEMRFYNGTTPDFGSQVVGFSETGTTLSFDDAADVAFSNSVSTPANYEACTYTPSAGYDDAVTYICLNPKGAMAAGDPDPTFTLQYRMGIK